MAAHPTEPQKTLSSESPLTGRSSDSGRCRPASSDCKQDEGISESKRRSPVENRLLAALPGESLERLLPYLEFTQLAKGEVLYEPGGLMPHAYFPRNGMMSLLSTTEDGMTIEVATVGNEGMIGIPIILGAGLSIYQVIVQAPSDALLIEADALKAIAKREQWLEELLLRYTHALLVQASQSAVCNRFHTLEQRLCRHLLTAQDRVNGDSFQMTQGLLSYLLGTRRTGVTQAAGALQEAGLIRYRWGRITIVDRHGLEAAACECYRTVKRELSGASP